MCWSQIAQLKICMMHQTGVLFIYSFFLDEFGFTLRNLELPLSKIIRSSLR